MGMTPEQAQEYATRIRLGEPVACYWGSQSEMLGPREMLGPLGRGAGPEVAYLGDVPIGVWAGWGDSAGQTGQWVLPAFKHRAYAAIMDDKAVGSTPGWTAGSSTSYNPGADRHVPWILELLDSAGAGHTRRFHQVARLINFGNGSAQIARYLGLTPGQVVRAAAKARKHGLIQTRGVKT